MDSREDVWKGMIAGLKSTRSSVMSACSYALEHKTSEGVGKMISTILDCIQSTTSSSSSVKRVLGCLYLLDALFKQEYEDEGETPSPDGFRALSKDLLCVLALKVPASDFRKVLEIWQDRFILPPALCEFCSAMLRRHEQQSDTPASKHQGDGVDDSAGFSPSPDIPSNQQQKKPHHRCSTVPGETIARYVSLDKNRYRQKLEKIQCAFRATQLSFDHNLDVSTAEARMKEAETNFFRSLWATVPPYNPRSLERDSPAESESTYPQFNLAELLGPSYSPPLLHDSPPSPPPQLLGGKDADYSLLSHSRSRSVSPDTPYSPDKARPSPSRHHRSHSRHSHHRHHSLSRREDEFREEGRKSFRDDGDRRRDDSDRRRGDRTEPKRIIDDRSGRDERSEKRYSRDYDRYRGYQNRSRSRSRTRSRSRSRTRGRR